MTEAENAGCEQFGEGRLIDTLSEKYEGAEVVVQRLGERVKEHVGEAEASDDLTMLCLEWKG